MSRARDLPDWRDASAYAPLLQVDRAAFAWEWLRRQDGYRRAASGRVRGVSSVALREDHAAALWGLHRFEDARLAAPLARPVWRADRSASVLGARAEPSADGADAFLLERHAQFATLVRSAEQERLLLSDGCRSIRIDVRGASLRGGPVKLDYDVSGFIAAKAAIAIIERLSALVLSKGFSPVLHRPDRRCGRNILMLRAHDALAAGADQRTIAAQLLSQEAAGHRWRIRSPSLRSQVQRLVRAARLMKQGEFWNLLL